MILNMRLDLRKEDSRMMFYFNIKFINQDDDKGGAKIQKEILESGSERKDMTPENVSKAEK